MGVSGVSGLSMLPFGGRGGRSAVSYSATFTVAAVDAAPTSRLQADYRCDGVDDQVEIQAAIDALPAAGGSIALTEGTFTLTEGGTEVQWGYSYGFLINRPVHLRGNRSVITIPNSVAMSAGGFCLVHPYQADDVWIDGISIDGNGAQQGANGVMGIYTHTCDRLRVTGCDVQDTALYAIDVDINCDYAQILGNHVHSNPGAGHHGIALHNTGDYNEIIGNIVEGIGGYGILVDSTNGFTVIGNIVNIALYLIAIHDISTQGSIIGNYLFGDNGTSFTINLSADCDGILMQGNTIRGFSIPQGEVNLQSTNSMFVDNIVINTTLINIAADAIVRNNQGFVTENSGTGSITNATTSDVIAHGLDVTPTVDDISILLAEDPDNTPGAIWVDTIGADNFTVNCENDPGASNLDFGWRVQVL